MRLFRDNARDVEFIRVKRAQHGFSGLEESSDNDPENEDK
jgi:hypothetical protein